MLLISSYLWEALWFDKFSYIKLITLRNTAICTYTNISTTCVRSHFIFTVTSGGHRARDHCSGPLDVLLQDAETFSSRVCIDNKMFEHFQLCFVNEVFLTGRVNVCVETQPDISARFRQHQYFQSVVCGGRTRCFSRVIRTFSGRVCGIFTNCKPEHKHRVIYNIQLLRYLDSSGSGCNGGGCAAPVDAVSIQHR